MGGLVGNWRNKMAKGSVVKMTDENCWLGGQYANKGVNEGVVGVRNWHIIVRNCISGTRKRRFL